MSAVKLLALWPALLVAQLASAAECGGTPLAGVGGVPKAW